MTATKNTSGLLTKADHAERSAGWAARLNRAKHRNPPSVFAALGLHTALLAEEITVTHQGSRYYVGTQSQEFCTPLGSSLDEVEATLKRLAL